MIKYIHTTRDQSIAYYYRERRYYDIAMASLKEYPSGTHRLMEMAEFAVDLIANQLVKNRSIVLEDLLDARFTPDIAV
jgi:hypothetical protein